MRYPDDRICPKCKEKIDNSIPYCLKQPCLQYTITKVNVPPTGGMFMYTREHKYPLRGFPQKERLDGTAQVKRVFMSTLRLAFKFKYLLPFLLIVPQKYLLNAVKNWVEEIYQADYANHQLDDNLYCQSAKELLELLRYFYGNQLWINCAVMIYETDTAYRFPVQDILGGELNQELLKANPKKEVLRLCDIFISRWVPEVLKEKARLLKKLVRLIFIFKPSIAKEITTFLTWINPEEMKMNVNDKYWTANKFHYNFGGEDYETRWAWRLEEEKDFVMEPLDHRKTASVQFQPNVSFFHLNEEDMENIIQVTAKQLRSIYKQGVITHDKA